MRRKCLFLKLDSVPESSSLTCCASCGKCSGGVSGFPEPTVDSSLQVLSCIAISTEQAKQGLKSQIVSKIYFDKNCFFHFGLEELSPFFFPSYFIISHHGFAAKNSLLLIKSGRSCHVPNVAKRWTSFLGAPNGFNNQRFLLRFEFLISPHLRFAEASKIWKD